MSELVKVETQGISDDWSTANGDFDTKSRGMLSADQVLSAMLHLAPLDTPLSDDPCPPHVLTARLSGQLSFVGQGGTIFCLETDQELTPHQASDLALGKTSAAPPPPMPPTSKTRKTSTATTGTATTGTQTPDTSQMKRKLGWRGVILILIGLGFFAGAATALAGVISMTSRGITGDDLYAAMILSGLLGLIGVGIVYTAFRRRSYMDNDGNAVPFVVMGQMLGDDIDGDDYGGDDSD